MLIEKEDEVQNQKIKARLRAELNRLKKSLVERFPESYFQWNECEFARLVKLLRCYSYNTKNSLCLHTERDKGGVFLHTDVYFDSVHVATVHGSLVEWMDCSDDIVEKTKEALRQELEMRSLMQEIVSFVPCMPN